MWLSILIIVGLVGGLALTVFGLGPPLGFVALFIGLVGLAAKFGGSLAGQGRSSDEPETVPGGHKATGHAHPGQEHMVP